MEIGDITKELLDKAANDDLDAFGEIYSAASGFVYNVALRVIGNAEDAQEAVQETFIKILRYLRNFHFQSSFKTWVYRITVNTALDMRRKTAGERSRRVEIGEDMDIEQLHPASVKENPIDRNLDARASREIVNRMLESLNNDQRVCVVLRDMQGLSYEEIAKTLKINKNTVRSRLKRAREILLRKGGNNGM
jgi:RNA polymerase sigma-70 factor, ECF subfamily